VAVYQDAAMSGALRDRKGYLGLVADALSGRFDLVVAESLDRLNRDLEETARSTSGEVRRGRDPPSRGPISRCTSRG
jgi:DNA invertase Pin-like site-specific DNA recombinase